ncbi:MAG: family 20 glycosylhydrolase, partial [Lachnospiraceae bacterium]|nr:family 20 glycosylhydrolase [Lachnospiraceae bacterium]
CLFLFIFLPQNYAVRQMNEQAYMRLMQQYEKSHMEAEDSAFPAVLTADDDTLPRDAAMVNGTRSLTCYMPTLSKNTQQTLRNFGYEVYWTATSSKGGSALSEELLTFAHLLKDGEEAGDSNRVPFSVDSRRAAVTVRIHDAGEAEANREHSVLQLPIISVNGWHCRLNHEKTKIEETKDGLLGVGLMPGENLLEFRFLPPGLYAGFLFSLLGLCVLLLQQRIRRHEELIYTEGPDGHSDEHLTEKENAGSRTVGGKAGEKLSEKAAEKLRERAGMAAGILFGILLTAGLLGIYILPFIGWTWNLAARLIPSVPAMEEVLNPSWFTAEDNADQEGTALLKAVPHENDMRVYVFGRNLMAGRGVRVTADSRESRQFTEDYVHDGITADNTLRWSSLNDRENSDHWLAVRFPEKQPIGMVRIYWERCNASRYALEFSENGEDWTAACEFDVPADDPVQDIVLPEYPETQHLRLHITEVLQNEEDLTLYYQNVSVLELEVYGAPADVMEIEVPQVRSGTGRVLEVPELRHTDGTITWIGADYPDLIDEEGNIQDTIADVPVKLGYSLSYDGMRLELPEMETVIPASAGSEDEYRTSSMKPGFEESASTKLPEKEFAEWLPTGGIEPLPSALNVSFAASGNNTDTEEQALGAEMAALFSDELDLLYDPASQFRNSAGSTDARKPVQIELVLADPEKQYAFPVQSICGEEGFNLDLLTDGETIRIFANKPQGLRWGCVTLKHILEKAQENGSIESGWIRDYPRYKVRGFGIDVGRRAVSMDLLYDIMVALSDSRMNTLQIHLNDNEIISQSADSGYDGSMESARNLYAGFRLESEIRNDAGIGITSEDAFYTKEEFRQLIDDARVYGIEIVPEIDMPAHSLAFTRVFPELGFTDNPEGADELDLGKAGAAEFAEKIWGEYLTDDAPVFGKCRTIHIGMDEYFGRGEDYISFLNNVAGSVSDMAPDKEIRIWGSLTYIGADHTSVSRNLQMQIWDTQWTDPGQMYGEGFRLINSISSSLYIIPGGGYDYLNTEFLRDSWQPNIFATKEKTWKMPSYSPQILGAVYMLWNDHAQAAGEQITEEGLFDRFSQPLDILAEKLW